MTDREKAIVMAYTGICMLGGERLCEFYEYLKELYSRPVYTHEFLKLNIKERSEKDFIELCKETTTEEEDCSTCKHGGYFGSEICNRCRVGYPSHYERRAE